MANEITNEQAAQIMFDNPTLCGNTFEAESVRLEGLHDEVVGKGTPCGGFMRQADMGWIRCMHGVVLSEPHHYIHTLGSCRN